jgi:hypothetical protein
MLREVRGVMATVVLALALMLLSGTALAQITTATVSGTVKDSQGGVVPGATVILISDTRGVTAAETVTDGTGNFVIPNVTADTYTVQVALQGFKTLRTSGITVSPGDRLALTSLVLQVGTLTETVQVQGETPLIQAASGERSFTVTTTSVDNLPIYSRNFLNLALLAPGVRADGSMAGVGRIGGGGYANIQMDGISAMDTGNNGQMLAMNLDAVAEVKVLTTAYQAEYGRSAGIQILSVTKGGTNHFHGGVYDIKTNSRWNENSKYNILNGTAKAVSKTDNWGYSVGGPIGKPGGNNKLFFFYSHEYRPRTSGNVQYNFRLPTDLERNGDFSQSRDNLGNLYPYIKDWTTGLPCSASNTAGCFQDGGVLGKIPESRRYTPGMNLLNLFPMMPNFDQTAGYNYNTSVYSPTLKSLQYQPAVRVDYQITSSLRVAFKFNGHNRNSGIRPTFGVVGAGYAQPIPGLTDSLGNQKPWVTTFSVSGNYNLGSKTFLEVLWGRTQNFYASVPTSPLSDRYTANLQGIPDIYSTNRDVNKDYWMYGALESMVAPFFVNGRIELPQQVSFGTRTSSAIGTPPYPGWLNVNQTWDVAGSVTHVRGRHTLKGGINLNHSFKAQNMTQGVLPMGRIDFGDTTNNPYDASFGYANLALGIYNTYAQASKFIESGIVYLGIEPYIQDNWKVNSRLTLDYGLRFVHLIPEHDKYMQAANFFPDQWSPENAPALYVPGCAGGVYPCSGSNRQAMNPLTGQLMGAGTAGLIGARIPGTGSLTNGIQQQGQGISKYNFTYPFLEVGPRAGFAYLLQPNGNLVLRGGFGMFFDRVEGNFTMSQSANPPTAESTTLYYGFLQNVGQAGAVASGGVPTLTTYRYANPHLPTAATWDIGVQWEMPYRFALDAAYVGQYSYDTMGSQGWTDPTNLNQIDLGTAYLAQNQDPTLSPSTIPGQSALTSNLLRSYQGYGNINETRAIFHRLSHSLQVTLHRRFANGFSASFNWNWVLYDKGNYGLVPRMQHVNGQLQYNPDWQQYQKLNEHQGTPTHFWKLGFVWALPGLHAGSGIGATIIQQILNDWRLSGAWTAQTGEGYSIGYSYQSAGTNQNLTGSPDYSPTIKIIGDPGKGCTNNQYMQFNTAAVTGPAYNSTGIDAWAAGRNYMTACGSSIWDLALARNIRLGGTRIFQLRLEMYNPLNAAQVTSRNTTVIYNNPTSLTVMNPQYNADGSLVQSRLKPIAAGFGAVTGWSTPRTVQLQLRFQF